MSYVIAVIICCRKTLASSATELTETTQPVGMSSLKSFWVYFVTLRNKDGISPIYPVLLGRSAPLLFALSNFSLVGIKTSWFKWPNYLSSKGCKCMMLILWHKHRIATPIIYPKPFKNTHNRLIWKSWHSSSFSWDCSLFSIPEVEWTYWIPRHAQLQNENMFFF